MYFCTVKRIIAIFLLLTAISLHAQEPADSLHHYIESVSITASLKGDAEHSVPSSTTVMSMRRLEERGITSVKELSTIAPNFYQPDYGSSITSSIYIRGFGSRIDQPVLGITVDDIPLMNKNFYDFDFYDIRRVELLRGPQGTLYGRNTSGGVMNITTLSPLLWQGFKGMAEYSTISSYRASASYYARPSSNFGISLSAYFNHDGGYFKNIYRDEMCDRGNSGSLRMKMEWLRGNWSFSNSITAGYTNEGGYAYHHYNPTTGACEDVAYNDPSGYERLTISEGFVAKYRGNKVLISSATSYNYLDDTMTLDQDFSPRSMFTMQQMQREHSITEEVVIRNADNKATWQRLSGVFLFAKWLDMSSPVTFKRDGIDELILGNANKNISNIFPGYGLTIPEQSFVISSDFRIPTYGVALYHQSHIQLGAWRLTAGIRFDLEHTAMTYNSWGDISVRFGKLEETSGGYTPVHSVFKGHERQLFFEILPKVAAEYSFSSGTAYATITRGYKSGGFNTQIFSDILQVQMMNDMMEVLGVQLEGIGTATYDSASATRYKPETSWNFEIGTHLDPINGLHIDGSLFWIECFDQQVTVLPKGQNTGRMMSNAARARSYGMELSAEYKYRDFSVRGDYGFTDARFREYNDGHTSYAGNTLPYAPKNTVAIAASYVWTINSPILQYITITADWRGVGSIYWDEANTLKQPFYSTLGAQLSLRMRDVTLTLWGRNLTNTDYNVFYFKSVGEEFFSKGRPIHAGIKLNINL